MTAPTTGAPGRLPPEARARMTLVLRIGLIAAIALLLGSLIAYLLANPGATSSGALAHNPIHAYLNVVGLADGIVAGRPEAWMTLGLLVLLATPIVRVLSGIYYFQKDGERTMLYITTTVFVLLLIGVLVIGPFIP